MPAHAQLLCHKRERDREREREMDIEKEGNSEESNFLANGMGN